MTAAPLREQALILAGGLGTRLQSVLADRPKVLAPIGEDGDGAGRPFLDILLAQVAGLGFARVVLLLGARHDQVEAHLERTRVGRRVEVALSIEDQPLGTGGAVKLAEPLVDGRFVLINGDTYFDFDARALLAAHAAAGAVITLGATRVPDAGRYGRLDVDERAAEGGTVRAFLEKDDATAGTPGLISAGVAVMEPAIFQEIPAGRAVSIEREVFPALLAAKRRIVAAPQAGAFFDIGTPASYRAFVDFHSRRAAPARAREAGRGGSS